jgi:hypothetical protein
VRLTPAERDSLTRYAKRHSSSLSTVLATLGRQLARGGGDQVAVMAEPSGELRELVVMLGRVAGSLNQLALKANMGGVVKGEKVGDLANEAHSIALTLWKEVLPWIRVR